MSASPSQMPPWLRAYPGVVVAVAANGAVSASNGRLEDLLGSEVSGRPFGHLLDPGSSAEKWVRLRACAAANELGGEEWELVLRGADSLAEPLHFVALAASEGQGVWLVERRRDARLERMADDLAGVNSELANTQRELVKERVRLAAALAALEGRGAELERSNRALDEFAQAVSHDLKTPLRAMANLADALLEEEPALGASGRTRLERLGDRAERMRRMIDGLLAYARAGREEAGDEDLDVSAFVAEVLDLAAPPPAVAVRVEAGVDGLRAPRAPLRQVLLNLLTNAIRYAAQSDAPLVVVRVEQAEDGVRFAIEDNGPGIEPRLQERIWRLFLTLEAEGQSEGTGVGLAVARKVVEAHGGSIGVTSQPGRGATFHFVWPARPALPGTT